MPTFPSFQMYPRRKTWEAASFRFDSFKPSPGQGRWKSFAVLSWSISILSLQECEIGPYTVLSHRLGSGSFATVHLAIDTVKHRQVACKVIKPRMLESKDKFRKEAELLKTLSHVCGHLIMVEKKSHHLASQISTACMNSMKRTTWCAYQIWSKLLSTNSSLRLDKYFCNCALEAISLHMSRAEVNLAKEKRNISCINSPKV